MLIDVHVITQPLFRGYIGSVDFRNHSSDRLQSIFTQLNDRERQVMSLIYGVGSDRHTMVEVGAIMNLNRERVRQIRDKALRKLRKARRQFLFMKRSRRFSRLHQRRKK